MAERRHIRLVTVPPVLVAAEDCRWLASQGYGPEVPLPRRATWYRADGHALQGLPTDPYHLRRYRERGLTLKPPPEPRSPVRAPRPPTPALARRVVTVMGGRDQWVGTAAGLIMEMEPSTVGLPKGPAALSRGFTSSKVTRALEHAGVTVARGYRGKERVLRLECLRGQPDRRTTRKRACPPPLKM